MTPLPQYSDLTPRHDAGTQATEPSSVTLRPTTDDFIQTTTPESRDPGVYLNSGAWI